MGTRDINKNYKLRRGNPWKKSLKPYLISKKKL